MGLEEVVLYSTPLLQLVAEVAEMETQTAHKTAVLVVLAAAAGN